MVKVAVKGCLRVETEWVLHPFLVKEVFQVMVAVRLQMDVKGVSLNHLFLGIQPEVQAVGEMGVDDSVGVGEHC